MLLSIITINWNNAAGLEKTLQSVASQTCRDFEHIIVDGASTDGSVDIIKSYVESAPHHVDWSSEPDKGIYNAMNKGIRKATGDYIQILNSGDCLAADDVVERMVGAAYPQPLPEGKGFCMPAGETAISEDLNSLPLGGDLGEAPTPSPLGEGRGEASILYGNMIKCFPDGRRMQDKCFAGQEITFLGMYTGTLNHSPAYIKHSLFDKYGYYDESLKIVSDWKWYLQAIVLGKQGGASPKSSPEGKDFKKRAEETCALSLSQENVEERFMEPARGGGIMVEPLDSSEIRYVDIDVTLFDMTGISETNKELDKAERRMVLEKMVPPAILADYDRFAFPIDQIKRLKRHPWAYKMVWFIERCLFKIEKSKNRRKASSQYQ